MCPFYVWAVDLDTLSPCSQEAQQLSLQTHTSSFCIQEGFYLWAQCTFNSCFSLFSTLALSSHTFLKEEEEHLKTIREGKRKPRPAGARLMRLQYNGEGHHICGVLAGMTDAGLLVTAGFPFWTSPHFSKDHLSNRHRAKFHMCVFNLCYFDLKQSVELWWTSRCYLLFALTTWDRWFRAKSMNWPKFWKLTYKVELVHMPAEMNLYRGILWN